MAKRERKNAPEVRLQALFDAGDWHAAWGEARRLRTSSVEEERAAGGVEQRMRVDPSAVWAASLGAALLAAVALLGLFLRRQ